MPDDCPRPAREAELTAQARVNFADGLYEFEAGYGRPPRSWRDYSYGLAHLGRAAARASIRAASAGRVAQVVKAEDWRTWLAEQRLHADW